MSQTMYLATRLPDGLTEAGYLFCKDELRRRYEAGDWPGYLHMLNVAFDTMSDEQIRNLDDVSDYYEPEYWYNRPADSYD
jgi:hypothetical protein